MEITAFYLFYQHVESADFGLVVILLFHLFFVLKLQPKLAKCVITPNKYLCVSVFNQFFSFLNFYYFALLYLIFTFIRKLWQLVKRVFKYKFIESRLISVIFLISRIVIFKCIYLLFFNLN
jgi:hypothetical protein